jgi:redox-sensitive bicupin YhaK (pirin superfamily)
MSLKIHRADKRGIADHGWLKSYFSFSFAEYHDTHRMGFGVLRVINDDTVEASRGFGMHQHRDMEIVSIVTKGELHHKDSEGNSGVVKAGEVQYMSAGSGVYHSEFASPDSEACLFQIWIRPSENGGVPKYNQRDFRENKTKNEWITIVSPNGNDNSITIKQDASIYIAKLDKQREIITKSTSQNHGRLIFVISGSIKVATHILHARDELQITDENKYTITALEDSEILLFDVAMD